MRLSPNACASEERALVGVDAIQALGLAWGLARQLLTSLDAAGDVLEYETGGAVPLSAYFDLADPEHPVPAT